MASLPTTQHTDKLLGIELLRCAMAFAVLVFHYQLFYAAAGYGGKFDLTAQPLFTQLRWLYQYGFFGVQVFWCISGFIFFARYSKSVSDRREPFRRFFVSRFSRLYPLHLLTLIAVAGMQAMYGASHNSYFVYQHYDLMHFVAQLFLASSWTLAHGAETYSFNGPIWSISLEVLAYGVFFVVARFIGVSTLVCIGVLLGTAVVDKTLGHHPVFTCLVYFYLGALAFKVFGWARQVSTRTRMVWLASIAIFASAGALGSLGTLSPALVTLVIAPTAVLASATLLRNAGDRVGLLVETLGNTTYSSYLLHFPLQLATVLVCDAIGIRMRLESNGFFIAYLISTFALAALCYRFFERPMQARLRRAFDKRRDTEASQPRPSPSSKRAT